MNSHSIDLGLLQETITSLIKQNKIQGSVKAGSFIPQIYEDKKNNAVSNFLRDNQYITKKLLKDNRVFLVQFWLFVNYQIDNPVEYFAKTNQSTIMELDSVWIRSELITDLTETMIEFCNEDGFVDITSIIPTPFTSEDTSMLFSKIDVFFCLIL